MVTGVTSPSSATPTPIVRQKFGLPFRNTKSTTIAISPRPRKATMWHVSLFQNSVFGQLGSGEIVAPISRSALQRAIPEY